MKITIEKKKPEPVLVSRFLGIRQQPEINPAVEDFSDLFSDEQYRKHSFEEAKKAFEFIFDKREILQHLRREPNEASLSYLKTVRRYGLILKALYKFMDSSHKCGEGLHLFVTFLGIYNDSYWTPPSGEIKKGVVNNLDAIELSVNFTDTSGFKEYITSTLSEMETLLQERVLPVDQFHTLRKKFRLSSNLMQIAAVEDYGGTSHWLFYSIFELSVEMGKQHDDLVQKGLNGEIDYPKSTLEVDSHVVSEFQRIKPFLERVCGLT